MRPVLSLLVSVFFILAGCSGSSGNQMYDKDQFIELLQQSKINVVHAAGSNTYAFFGLQPEASQYMKTDLGTMDVTFFDHSIENKISVKDQGNHDWEIMVEGKDSIPVGSNRPIYFLIYRNLFIQTHEEELYSKLKEIFNQP